MTSAHGGRRYAYALLDVFTDAPFGGNPLAVFLDANGLTTGEMQRIAGELNLSESMFLEPAGEPGAWRGRIFTPALELPFAGHPTVGAAIALLQAGRLAVRDGEAVATLHEQAGVMRARVRLGEEGGGAASAAFQVPVAPDCRDDALPPERLAALLGLAPEDIGTGDWRPRTASCGVPFHMVALNSLDAVRRAQLRPDVFASGLATHRAPHVYLFARGGTRPDVDLQARMFAPAMGVAEDPATGGAAAALAGYLAVAETEAQGPRRWVIEQGIQLGRPSRIELRATLGAGRATGVSVGGQAVVVGGGHLDLSPAPGSAPAMAAAPSTRPRSRATVAPYAWGGDCQGWRLLDGEDLAVTLERMPPGREEALHRHARARQLFFGLAGVLSLVVEGEETRLGAQEGLEVAPGRAHRVVNRGPAAAEFLVVSSPSTRRDREALPTEDSAP